MKKNHIFALAGLGVALTIAIFLSPFASKDPDGLDRVSKDLKFEEKAAENTAAKQLPFRAIFEEYSVKGIPDEKVATAIAGLIGTLTTFGIALGIGKLTVRGKDATIAADRPDRPVE
ncbi:PDGLE domain-containing protein [Tumidithrix helvetica PCC 7403]|uniref:PDGLE domain-containing protein n=1 Tax=Tumidithrix helvetica TaxID=3457545 RepID=UPI003CB0564E